MTEITMPDALYKKINDFVTDPLSNWDTVEDFVSDRLAFELMVQQDALADAKEAVKHE